MVNSIMSARPNILYICPPFEAPILNGGGQRTVLLYRALSTFCSLTPVVVSSVLFDNARQEGTKAWLGQEAQLVICGLSGGRVRITDMLTGKDAQIRFDEYDGIVFRHFQTYRMCGSPANRNLIVDTDDMPWHANYLLPSATLRSRLSMLLSRGRTIAAYLASLRKFRLLFVAKREDLKWTGGRGTVLPNIPWQIPPAVVTSRVSGAASILAVAGWKWQPNVDGMRWFLRECWPAITKMHPQVELVLAGDIAPETGDEWRRIPRVKVLGRVDDVAGHYAKSAFTIAPIFAGGGTNIKVLESLGFQRTCVATPHAMRGHAGILRNEDSLLVALSAGQFTAAVKRLLSDRELSKTLADRGRQLIMQHYSRDAFDRMCLDAVSAALVSTDAGKAA